MTPPTAEGEPGSFVDGCVVHGGRAGQISGVVRGLTARSADLMESNNPEKNLVEISAEIFGASFWRGVGSRPQDAPRA